MLLGTPQDDTLSKTRNLANKNHNVNFLIEKNISYILNKKYFLVWAVVLLPKLCDKNNESKIKQHGKKIKENLFQLTIFIRFERVVSSEKTLWIGFHTF